MPLGTHPDEMDHDGSIGVGPEHSGIGEVAVEDVITDGSEETLFDDEEVRDYDLGEGD